MTERYNRRALWAGVALGMLLAALPVFAASVEENFEHSYPVSANVRVSLSNINGSVEITGWDKNEVRVEAVKRADSKEKLARLKIDIQASKDSVAIKTDLPSGTNNNPGSVDYEIHVPRNARLDKIDTVNGSVEISDVRGSVEASSVNGKVQGRGLTGDIDLHTVNGSVDCEAIDFSAARNVKLSTVNGGVELSMPRDADAHLTASTVHGGISSNFNLPIKKHFPVGSDLDTTLGSGKTSVNLSSVNGGISIRSGAKGL